MLASCPSRDQLAAYFCGKIPEGLSAEIAEHLSACAKCKDIAASVENLTDLLADRLRQLKSRKPLLSDPDLPQLLARVKAAAPTVVDPPKENVAEPPPPQCIGNYRILERLGKGGMGVVYKARHIELDRLAAIKLMISRRLESTDDRARFRREGIALARLRHPNVAMIYDAGQTDGLPFFIMEYIDGRTLGQLVSDFGKLPVAEACELMNQAAQGLQHAHDAGIVHRDIKPANLMLDMNGTLKILDLGLARSEEMPSGTASGHIMGTPEYMAPEQCEPTHPVDFRADLYSLGCTLYHLLAGRPPFAERTRLDRLTAHCKKTPKPISNLPKELNAIIQKMLAKKPCDRHGSANEVATELARFSEGANLKRLLQAPPGRKPELPTVDYVASSTIDAIARPTVHGAPSRARKPWLWLAVALAALSAAILGVYFAAGPVPNIEMPKETPPGTPPVVVQNPPNPKPVDLPVNAPPKGAPPVVVQNAPDPKLPVNLPVEPPPVQAPQPPNVDDGPVGQIADMGGFRGPPDSVAFSPSSPFAVTSDYGNTLRLWDLQKRKQSAEWAKPKYSNVYAVFNPDGRTAASAFLMTGVSYQMLNMLDFFDPANGKTLGKLESNKYASYDISFSASGKFFLAPSCSDGFVRIWSVPSLQLLREFKHCTSTDTACFTSDEEFALSGGDDNVIRLWDIKNDRQEKTYAGHEQPLRLVRAFSDRGRFVSVSSDGKVIVWDLKSGKQLKTWTLANMERGRTPGKIDWTKGVFGLTIHSKIVAVAPKGNRLLAGHNDGSITVWDLDQGEQIGKLEGHNKGAVTAIDIAPDGRYALSGGEDLTLRYWRLPPLTVVLNDRQNPVPGQTKTTK